jgi:hypothetical protein
MRISSQILTWSAVLSGCLVAAGCGDKSAPTPEAAAPAKPAPAPPTPPTGDAKGWTRVESWKAGQPLPKGARASRPTPPPGTPPEVTGTAEVICQELLGKVNHDKYFAKVLQVDGVTVPPPTNLFPNAKVKFALAGVPKPFNTERWDVVGTPAPGEEEKVKALAPGRKVRVVGYVIGTAGLLGMEQCVVTDLGPGPEPTPVREAAEVAAEFVKDGAAARKKYGLSDDAPAVLLLRGKVAESAAEGDTGTYRLAGADGATVLVAMKVDQYTKVPEVGKTVTAGGVFDGYDAASKALKLRTGSVIPY